jgi:hypothetical protein
MCYFPEATPLEQTDLQDLKKFIRERVSLLSMNYDSLTNVESSLDKAPNHCKTANQNQTKINILMIGDSINRNLVDDICLKPARLRKWGEHFQKKNPPGVCESVFSLLDF